MKHTDPTGFDPKPPAVSTPLVGAGRTFKVQGNGAVAVTLKNGVNVTILPDKFDLQPGEDPQTLPSIEPIQGQISSRTKKITYKITIQTRYPKGSDPSEKQAYGRGTTDQDVKAGNTSVRFHEGQHGASALDYVESHPLPQLNPMGKKYTQDWTWRDAADEWKTAFDTYGEGFQDFHVQSTDCVGHEPYFCK